MRAASIHRTPEVLPGKLPVFIIPALFLVFFLNTARAEEITITTYYPSPSGSYDALISKRFSVGDVNGDGNINASDISSTDGYLLVADKIGVGTTAPNADLNTTGGISIGTGGGVSSTEGARRSLQFITDTDYGGVYDAHSGYLMYSTMPGGWGTAQLNFAVSTNWGVYNTASPTMTLYGTKVGVGTATPSYTLDVNGTIRLSGAGIYNSSGYQLLQGNATDWIRIGNASFTNGAAIYNNIATNGGLSVGAWTAPGAGNAYFSGNVGIKTATPQSPLDVVGRISSTMARAQFSTYGDWYTTSTSWVNTDVAVTTTTTGGPLLLLFNTQAITNTAGQKIGLRFTIDGSEVTSAPFGNAIVQNPTSTTTCQQSAAMVWLATGISAGSHTIRVQVKVSGGTGYIGEASSTEGSNRTLIVIEL